MKHLFLVLIACVSLSAANAQQGLAINTDASQPNASALLDVQSTTKGFLLPRMTAVQRNAIVTPATGLQVYQTDSVKGFYYYDGSAWTQQSKGGATTAGWSTSGNASVNPATNFIGTTDAQPFIGKVNGQQVFRFSSASTSTLVGYQAGKATPAGGEANHIIGYKAGFSNTGFDNQFEGYQAGYKNTSGYDNMFIGFKAGFSTTTGTDNLFIGSNSGYHSTTLSGSHFIGQGAGFSNTTGAYNHFNGYDAGQANTTGSNNHFEGNHAGFSNISGSNNQFEGLNAGYNNTEGGSNLFVGNGAGYSNTAGNRNLAFGFKAGYSNTTGNDNLAIGYASGYKNETGGTNTYIGQAAGYSNVSGFGNVAIGYAAGYHETGYNKLYIANSAQNTLLYGEFDNKFFKVNGTQEISPGATGSATLTLTAHDLDNSRLKFQSALDPKNSWSLDAQYSAYGDFVIRHIVPNTYSALLTIKAKGDMIIAGKLTELSDKSLKTNIMPLKSPLQKLMKLGGYTYNWINEKTADNEQIGLIAQEVEAQFPQLVNTEKNGLKSVSYTHMVPIIIESIKEQQKMIDDLKATNIHQQKENDQLKKDMAAIKTKLGL